MNLIKPQSFQETRHATLVTIHILYQQVLQCICMLYSTKKVQNYSFYK